MANHFTLFALESQFPLDEKELSRRYFAEQQRFHPDRFMDKPENERLAALQQSMLLNEAYNILKNPLKRAQYLLSLSGIEVNGEHDTVKPSQALLIENMEQREALSEADSPEMLAALADQAARQQETHMTTFAGYYAANQLDEAAQAAIAWRYAIKLAEEIKLKRMHYAD